MKKALSLNTQLTKLRTVNNLLKQSIPEAIFTKENGFKDSSLCEELRQVIYSLRDIQYMLRGLDYKAHRSTQTRKMNIIEIREYLHTTYAETTKDLDCGKFFRHNLYIAYTELGSVEQFLQLKGYLSEEERPSEPAPTIEDIENDELY